MAIKKKPTTKKPTAKKPAVKKAAPKKATKPQVKRTPNAGFIVTGGLLRVGKLPRSGFAHRSRISGKSAI